MSETARPCLSEIGPLFNSLIELPPIAAEVFDDPAHPG